MGGHFGAPIPRRLPRSATAPPWRDERWGAWGAISGPPYHGGCRGAPRLRRGVTSVGGHGEPCRGADTTAAAEERHGSAVAGRAMGGMGGHFGAPHPDDATLATNGGAAHQDQGGAGDCG